MSTAPTISATPDVAIGRPCPYCQTALAAGESSATCGDCAASHHEDCWVENTGCAIPGCESAPDPLAATVTAPTAVATSSVNGTATGGTTATRIPISLGGTPSNPAAPSTGAGVAWGSAASPKRRSKMPWIVGILVVLVFAAGALALASGKKDTSGTTASDPNQSAVDGSNAARGTPYSGSQAQAEHDIAANVRTYFTLIKRGSQGGALSKLSESKRSQIGVEGLQTWWNQQTAFAAQMGSIDAAKVSALPQTGKTDGIAQAQITGITWSGSECGGTFTGLIWAVHQGSSTSRQWLLEPGATTTASRTTRFGKEPAANQLLGYPCTKSID